MRRLIPVALCLLALSGCDNRPKESAPQGLNRGQINFATILVLDDLIANGIRSDFVSLSPVPIVDPDQTVSAESVLEDFRKDFVDAKDKYPLKLAEGISITLDLDHNADTQYGMSFHKEDRDEKKKTVFAGKLSVTFDPEFYSATPYPTYSKDSGATVVCREFTAATERRNEYLAWVEVSLGKCLAATDYYSSVRGLLRSQQAALNERLTNVFEGKEQVREAVAQKLVTFYQAGSAFAEDSVCLTGSREACLPKLKEEIVRKHEDARIGDIDSIKVLPEGSEPKPEATQKPAAGQPKADVAVEEKAPDGSLRATDGDRAEQKAVETAGQPVEDAVKKPEAEQAAPEKQAEKPGG